MLLASGDWAGSRDVAKHHIMPRAAAGSKDSSGQHVSSAEAEKAWF